MWVLVSAPKQASDPQKVFGSGQPTPPDTGDRLLGPLRLNAAKICGCDFAADKNIKLQAFGFTYCPFPKSMMWMVFSVTEASRVREKFRM